MVAQVLAQELGLDPGDVTVVDEMDTFTRVWSISSGTYSSRFGAIGASAAALAARKLKARLIEHAAALLDVRAEDLEFRDGAVRARTGQGPSYSYSPRGGGTGRRSGRSTICSRHSAMSGPPSGGRSPRASSE